MAETSAASPWASAPSSALASAVRPSAKRAASVSMPSRTPRVASTPRSNPKVPASRPAARQRASAARSASGRVGSVGLLDEVERVRARGGQPDVGARAAEHQGQQGPDLGGVVGEEDSRGPHGGHLGNRVADL